MAGLTPASESAAAKPVSRHAALFRLRGKLTWRRFTGQKGRIVGFIFALLFVLPLIVGIGIGSWFGYTRLPQPWPTELLGLVLVLIWAAWIVLPVLFAPLSESLSLEQLLIYPLRRRDLVISTLLGTLFDFATYFTLPIFLALLIAFGSFGRLAAEGGSLLLLPLLLLVVALAYLHMAVTSQLFLTALGGILQSRRTRDVAIVLASLFGFGCWAMTQLMEQIGERLTSLIEPEQLLAFRPLATLQWLPTGALARAVEQATTGAWGGALLWLLYSAGWLLLLAWAWGALLNRLLTGEGFLLSLGPVAERKPARRVRDWALLDRLFGAQVRAIAVKELRAAWRIPQRRIGTLQGFLLPLIIAAPLLSGGVELTTLFSLDTAPFVLPVYTLFIFWVQAQNMLGWEHRGLPTLLLTPVPRRSIFLGKSLALFLLGIGPLVPLYILFAVLSGSALSLVWIVLAVGVALPALAVGSIASALLPYPVQLEFRRNRNTRARAGCVASLAYLIPVPLALVITALPLVAPAAVYRWLNDAPWLLGLLSALALFYAGAVFVFGTRWAGHLLSTREPEAIEAAKPLDED